MRTVDLVVVVPPLVITVNGTLNIERNTTNGLSLAIYPAPFGICGSTKSDIVASGEREPVTASIKDASKWLDAYQ